jgi:hypothetical protein
VVESSLGVPTGCAGMLRWHTTGMFGEATMAESWDGVGKAAMAEPIRQKRVLLDGCDAHLGSEYECSSVQRVFGYLSIITTHG